MKGSNQSCINPPVERIFKETSSFMKSLATPQNSIVGIEGGKGEFFFYRPGVIKQMFDLLFLNKLILEFSMDFCKFQWPERLSAAKHCQPFHLFGFEAKSQ